MIRKPPVALPKPHKLVHLGEERVDPYFWLREKTNPEVLSYLKEENEYTEDVFRELEPCRKLLFDEMKARLKEDDSSVPTRDGEYFYYTRKVPGQEYDLFCRKKGSLTAPEEILLDCNELAQGLPFFSLMYFEVSEDHRLLAYSIDNDGSEIGKGYFKDLTTGKLLPDHIERTGHSFEWANDNKTYFYTTLDESQRPYRCYKSELGGAPELIFEEPSATFFINLSKSRSRRFLFMEIESLVTSEVFAMDLDQGFVFRLIEPRRHNVQYDVDHQGERFLIRTNDSAVNFRLVEAPLDNPGRSSWRELRAGRANVFLRGVDAFQNFLVTHLREDGLDQMEVLDLRTSQEHRVAFDEKVYGLSGYSNPEYTSEVYRFQYTSYVYPSSVYDYDLNSRAKTLLKRDPVLGDFNPDDYEADRMMAPSHDGVLVPVSVVYRKGLKRDGSNPVYLYSYGSYGSSLPVRFSSWRLSLLDRGFVMAFAHIRGGSDLGRQWYLDGKLLKKKNTFHDFIACAERLIKEGFTKPQQIAISGGSAGGMLMGVVANWRPELFKLVIAHVPFVDVVNTMLDPDLLLTQIEYDEWGNPNEKEYYDYIKSYSPYDNVRAQAYPNVFITGGFNDPRVTYWEPAKWTARLRELKTDNNLLCLKINMEAGHAGLSGRYQALEELAEEFAFLFRVFGVRVPV